VGCGGLAPGAAALWIAARFKVPMIPAGKGLAAADRSRRPVGYESGLELLIHSGLWGSLSEATRAIAPVFLTLSEKEKPTDEKLWLQISYAGIARYSGIRSPNAIRSALVELGELGFLEFPEACFRQSPARQASEYIVTPNSDQLMESAHAFAIQMKNEIAAERELRAQLRREKTRAWREKLIA
jgi:hypothetical protein